jgi:hypothetical protein
VRGTVPYNLHRILVPYPHPWEGEAPAEPPECSKDVRLSRSFALPTRPAKLLLQRLVSPGSTSRDAHPLPYGRGSWLTALGVGASVEIRVPSQPHKTQHTPLAPAGGDGSGVRGNATPKNISQVVHCPCSFSINPIPPPHGSSGPSHTQSVAQKLQTPNHCSLRFPSRLRGFA